MALYFRSFNYRLVNAVFSIYLKLELGNQTNVDVTASERRANREGATFPTGHSDNSNSILGGLGLNISSIYESNRFLGGCGEAKRLVNKRYVIIDGCRNHADTDFEVAFSHKIFKLRSCPHSAESTNQI